MFHEQTLKAARPPLTSHFRGPIVAAEVSPPRRQAGSESINMTTLRIASCTLLSAILFAEQKDFVSAHPAISIPHTTLNMVQTNLFACSLLY